MRFVAVLVVALACPAAFAAATDPHLDRSLVPTGCKACHKSHGKPRSPMLPKPQKEICLDCHGTRANADRRIASGDLISNAQVALMDPDVNLAYSHPLTEGAMHSREPGVVTCSSCHSPHRSPSTAPGRTSNRTGQKVSPKNPRRFEFELCQRCHGSKGIYTQDLTDISRLTNVNNVSYHPIEAGSNSRSPSLIVNATGPEINCTDCHNTSSTTGPRGPHASEFQYILAERYTTTDGSQESKQAYALCYRCHDRAKVLDESPFPYHRKHVQEENVSCATCHNPHGAVENRSLIRFGEEASLGGTQPSMGSQRLEFESLGPGTGACYVSCHGVDHDPATYGGLDPAFFAATSDPTNSLDPLAIPSESVFGPANLNSPRTGPRERPPRRPPPPN